VLVSAVQRVPRRYRHLPLLGAGAVVAAGAAFVAANPGGVLALLGRDSTLTGRALIWQIVQRLIADRPVLGYGWGATWDPTDRIRSTVSTLAKFDVPSAHNGYLDAWLQAGAIGLVAFLLLVLLVLGRGIGLLLRTESPLARWAPVYVSALLVYNIGEANLDSSLVIFLLTATLTKLHAVRRDGDPTLEAPAESGPSEGRGLKTTSRVPARRRHAPPRRGASVVAPHGRRANVTRRPGAPRGRKGRSA
jgi:O-antigen ligase